MQSCCGQYGFITCCAVIIVELRRLAYCPAVALLQLATVRYSPMHDNHDKKAQLTQSERATAVQL